MKYVSLTFILIVILWPGKHVYCQSVWTQKANFPGSGYNEAATFSIGLKGYVGGPNSDLWEYDPLTNSWTQMASFTGPGRNSAAGFAIGTKGYLGTGGSYNDFYEWDQPSNTWTQKANFGGSGREGAIGFATSVKGYIGMGGNYLNDLWEYDPVADNWTQMNACPGPGRYHAGAFSINDKGYVCTGFNGNFLADLWEFDPPTNNWTQKTSLPGTTRDRPEGWAIGTKGYIAVGWSGSIALNDFFEYDQPTDSWTQLPNYPGTATYNAFSFAIGFKSYLGGGIGGGQNFWEYGSNCTMSASLQNTTCGSLCDGSATLTLPDPGAVVSYSWNTIPVQTTQTATGLCAAVYQVTMTDTNGCSNTIPVSISGPAAITATGTLTEPSCFGASDGSICAVPAGGSGSYTAYLWSNGQTTLCATGISSGTYTITVTDQSGCTGSSQITLSQPSQMIINLSHTNATCPTCANGNATANITGGNGPYVFSWSNGVTNSAYITGLLPGTYTCCITDANGCTVCDSTVVSSTASITDPDPLQLVSCTPNPFYDIIEVNMTGPGGSHVCQGRLYDITGRTVMHTELLYGLKQKLSPQTLEPGIYFLEISLGADKKVLKLLKNNH